MEKYGCNRLEDVTARINELEQIGTKLAHEQDELKDLYESKKELEAEKKDD